jgi:lipoprotein-anchoring transpeptidase ErfK/SrfK
MTQTKRIIRIAVAAVLALALILTGIYFPAAVGSPASGNGENGATGFAVAYADTTPAAVTTPEDISAAVIAPISDRAYSGERIKPTLGVTLGTKKLKKNRDYTIKYSDNKLPGTATVVISGKAPNYTGTLQTTFNIIVRTPKEYRLRVSNDFVTASWKRAAGKIDGYEVFYASDESFSSDKRRKVIESTKTTSYSIDRPFKATSFYVKVRSFVKIKKKKYYSEYTYVRNKETKDVGWYSKISDKIGSDTKWIDIDLSKQIVYLHKGDDLVKAYACSTGKPGTPTPKGTFSIYKKIKLHDMKGDWNPETQEWGYVAKDVPWATYFVSDIAFHGASWNPQVNLPLDQKRIPKSHGCVNMRVADAKYLYNWGPMGTLVSVHK